MVLIKTFNTVEQQDDTQIAHLSVFEDLDEGEIILMLATANTDNALLITGDKRCLKVLLDNQTDAIIANLVKSLNGRVYCFELALLHLIGHIGFNTVKTKVLNRCVDDGMLKAVFRESSSQADVEMGLRSYCRDCADLLAW